LKPFQIKNINEFKNDGKINGLFNLLLRASLDGLIGVLIIVIFIIHDNLFNVNSLIFIFLGMFFAVLPDIVLAIVIIFGRGKFSQKYIEIHEKYFHIKTKREGKITFLGLFTQILVVIITLLVFFS